MKRCSNHLSTTPYYTLGEDNLIDRFLPVEIFQYAISYLASNDMQSVVLVSRRWKEVTIDLNKQIFRRITKFLSDHLPDYSSSGPFKLENLNDIANSTLELKESVLTSLGKLNMVEFQELRTVVAEHPHPVFFDHLIQLVPLYMDLELVMHLRNSYFGSELIIKSLDNLIKNGCIVPVRYFIKVKPHLWTAYHIDRLTTPLINHGHFKTALEFANLIKRDASRNLTLSTLCLSLAQKDQLGWLKKFFDAISDPLYKTNAISKIKTNPDLKEKAASLEKFLRSSNEEML